jgi:hypothetical protein
MLQSLLTRVLVKSQRVWWTIKDVGLIPSVKSFCFTPITFVIRILVYGRPTFLLRRYLSVFTKFLISCLGYRLSLSPRHQLDPTLIINVTAIIKHSLNHAPHFQPFSIGEYLSTQIRPRTPLSITEPTTQIHSSCPPAMTLLKDYTMPPLASRAFARVSRTTQIAA